MLSIHDLLEDPKYKEFFCKVPPMPDFIKENPDTNPWRLYVKLKKDGSWRSRDFHTYKEAFVKLKSMLPKVSDAAITCKSKGFTPPYRVVRIKNKYQTNRQGGYVLDAEGNKKPITKMVFWKPRIPADEFEDHIWCPYCRRPTVFRYFISHHALPIRKLGGIPIDPTVLRCAICGASERLVNLRGAK